MKQFIKELMEHSESVVGSVKNYMGTEASLSNFFEPVKEELKKKECGGLAEAIKFASECHEDQKRWDGSPYILHPLRVMSLCEAKWGYDEELLTVAVLHDVVEDCGVKGKEIVERFGPEVGLAVAFLSKTKGMPYKDYIGKVKTNDLATKVKICDIEDNSRIAGQTGTNASLEKQGVRYAKYAWAYNYLTM